MDKETISKAVFWLYKIVHKKSGGTIDINVIQKQIHDEMPPFSSFNGLMVVITSILFWHFMHMACHFMVFRPFLNTEKYLIMNEGEKYYHVSNLNGSIHAWLSGIGAIYCLVYADGQAHTTWFICNFYKLHMFDVQKYLVCISLGFII